MRMRLEFTNCLLDAPIVAGRAGQLASLFREHRRCECRSSLSHGGDISRRIVVVNVNGRKRLVGVRNLAVEDSRVPAPELPVLKMRTRFGKRPVDALSPKHQRADCKWVPCTQQPGNVPRRNCCRPANLDEPAFSFVFGRGHDQVGMTVLKQERNRISCQLVIGIEKEQEVSLAALEPEVSGCGDASVVSCQDGTRNGIWQVVLHDARSAVLRAIINHDYLQLTVVLGSDEPCDRFQSSRQRRFGVVGGNENAQQRRIGRTGSVWCTSSRRRMVHGPSLLKKVAVIVARKSFLSQWLMSGLSAMA